MPQASVLLHILTLHGLVFSPLETYGAQEKDSKGRAFFEFDQVVDWFLLVQLVVKGIASIRILNDVSLQTYSDRNLFLHIVDAKHPLLLIASEENACSCNDDFCPSYQNSN